MPPQGQQPINNVPNSEMLANSVPVKNNEQAPVFNNVQVEVPQAQGVPKPENIARVNGPEIANASNAERQPQAAEVNPVTPENQPTQEQQVAASQITPNVQSLPTDQAAISENPLAKETAIPNKEALMYQHLEKIAEQDPNAAVSQVSDWRKKELASLFGVTEDLPEKKAA